ncbi:MAG: selenocysteine-specific translation elongation factor [Rubrivivax sp.]|nr:selenocysteine-specific translation elongation factor [Rubrivivax sp.]
MIIGTAGHIDHGKTSLVKALTGVDTDRLKEEKERGITVDLGFAYQALSGGEVLGFVDVPGHEKLVRNMLAGATGIDHVMLVVAADDGPMPQTREHLAILRLLGLDDGAVVITKCDLADEARLQQVRHEIAQLLAGGSLQHAPVLAVSSTTGEGLPALRAHLDAARSASRAHRLDAHFRLTVDRSFSLSGIGTVLTGTAVSGRVQVGDRLLVSPSGHEVRVRGIHAQNRQSTEGLAGQRLALNVAGVDKAQVRRGDTLVQDILHAPTQRLDVQIELLASEGRPLAHWTPVHLHLGAEDVQARVLLLEGAGLAPGERAFAQLELERPIAALWGDRFILRDQSALRTLGGGRVVDAHPPDNRRKRSQRVDMLRALAQDDPTQALAAALALKPSHGVDALAFLRQRNLLPEAQQALLAAVPHRSLADGGQTLLFAPGQLEAHAQRITEHLAAFHRKSPDSPGLTQEQLTRQVRDKPATAVFTVLLQQLVRDGSLRRNGPQLALAGHEPTLQGAEKQVWERLKPWLDEGGIHPPKLSEMLERDRNLRKDQVMRTLQRLQRMGKVHAVGAEYFIQTPHMLELTLRCQALAQADANQRLNVRDMRESLGISRHLSVPLVEFFDEVGLTARDALGRHFKRDPRKMFVT